MHSSVTRSSKRAFERLTAREGVLTISRTSPARGRSEHEGGTDGREEEDREAQAGCEEEGDEAEDAGAWPRQEVADTPRARRATANGSARSAGPVLLGGRGRAAGGSWM